MNLQIAIHGMDLSSALWQNGPVLKKRQLPDIDKIRSPF